MSLGNLLGVGAFEASGIRRFRRRRDQSGFVFGPAAAHCGRLLFKDNV